MKNYDVIIVGAGPAGIFTAIELLRKSPDTRVLMVDMGTSIDKRTCPARKLGRCVHCNPCNIMSGWAGAGAFSDGKLSLSEEVGGNLVDYMSHKEAQELIKYADSIYTEFGAPGKVHGLDDPKVGEIMYDASRYNIQLIPCPVRHMGTELSLIVLENMYKYLKQFDGFEFRDHTTADEIITEGGKVVGVTLANRKGEHDEVRAPYIVAAPDAAARRG